MQISDPSSSPVVQTVPHWDRDERAGQLLRGKIGTNYGIELQMPADASSMAILI
jgi:hypothetical protein